MNFAKNKKDIILILFLNILTLSAIIFVLTYFFRVDPFTYFTFNHLIAEFPSFNVSFSKFDFHKVEAIGIPELLIVIVGTLGSILAIVFSLTFIGIEKVSEKYTHLIVEKYWSNGTTQGTLISFFILIIVSVLFIFISKLISNVLLLFYSLIIVFSFTVCISFLIKYFYLVVTMIDPISFASVLKSEIIRAIKKNKKNEANTLIINLGDIAIKALQREEKQVVIEYISKIDEIFLQCCSQLQNISFLSSTLDSYQRILSYSIQIESDLRFMIIHILTETHTIFQFSKDVNGMKVNKFRKDVFDEYQNYLDKLYFINKEIIYKNDFELFKEEIESISFGFVSDPQKHIILLKEKILLFGDMIPDIYQDKKIISKKKNLDVLLHSLEVNFANLEFYEEILNEFKDLFSSSLKLSNTIQDKNNLSAELKELEETLFKFYLDSNFHKTFFIISAYCLFNGERKKTESVKFVRELWFHTKTEDPYYINLDEVPVTSDIEFLLNMLFWGGTNDSSWFNKYSFDKLFDSKVYIYEYTVLLLTYLLEQHQELSIRISEEMNKKEIQIRYSFFKQFINASDELIIQCEKLIQDAKRWSFLLPPKKQQNKDSEFIDVSTIQQFNETKKWLQDRKEEFNQNIVKCETFLPIDQDKESICKNEILKSFKLFSEISSTTVLSQFDPTRDSKLIFISISYRALVPKNCLISPSDFDCSNLWFDMGRKVAFKEINYFINTILSGNIEKTQVETEDILTIYYLIQSKINSLYDNDFKPSTIFLPLHILSALRKEAQNEESKLYGKFPYSDRNIFYYNESTKLEIIHSSKYTLFNEIIILDKNFCTWTFKPAKMAEERLSVEIKTYEPDPSKLDLTIETVINLKITNFDSIKSISFSK